MTEQNLTQNGDNVQQGRAVARVVVTIVTIDGQSRPAVCVDVENCGMSNGRALGLIGDLMAFGRLQQMFDENEAAMTAKDVFNRAFQPGRDPRSAEYKAGVMAVLVYRVDGGDTPLCPYQLGTARADAWFAGTTEGHELARGAGR